MKADLLFLNNKAMEELGVLDMRAVMHDVERVYVMMFDNGLHLIDFYLACEGTVNEAYPYARAIAERAVRKRAASVLIAHNHPNGFAVATAPDREFTHTVEQALKIFNEITPTNLSRTTETMFYFHLGYTYLNMDKYDEALAILRPLKQKQNPYYLQAIYYIGYCYYKQNLYPQALSEFLILEELGGYQKIAPYYIVQIYYANGEYDKVFNHAKQLLTNNPDNDYTVW